ncbi:MAG: hypothetical protein IJL19_01825 [Clostridiales bacterium]|nr:hypothetical protein [Clostridiales bacterium]
MDNDVILKEKDDFLEDKEKVWLGILGAFLLSLIGGGIWCGFLWIDIFRPVCGIAIVVFAIIGYRVFTKKNSTKGLVISILVSLFTVVLTNYFVLVIEVYYSFKQWYADGQYFTKVSFFEAIRGSYQFLSEETIRAEVLRDLGLGVAFLLLGAFPFIVDAIKRHRNQPYN